jgi:uncharacterized protein YxeA
MKKVIVVIVMVMLLTGCGVMNKIEQQTNQMGNMLYSQYEGQVIGSTVLMAAMMEANSDISIYVRTGVNKEGFYLATKGCYILDKKDKDIVVPANGCTYASNIKNQGDPTHYVYEFGNFDSKLYKDKSGQVKLIIMEQNVN